MQNEYLKGLDLSKIETPAYILETQKLKKNLKLLREVEEKSGAKILLALKGFSMYSVFPIISKYLCGTTSSGLNEALLAREYFGGEIHVYSPAFEERELRQIARFAHTIVFNSQPQLDRFLEIAKAEAKNAGNEKLEISLRVNPEYAEVETEIYNPCAPKSRLGELKKNLRYDTYSKLDCLNFHAMCEQNSDVLERVLEHFEAKFGDVISKVKRVNFGGGHHITRPDYDLEKLIYLIKNFYKKYPNIETIYLEPGEAIALNAGVFVAEVLEIHENAGKIAILNMAAPCHMPDVLEMPYRPVIVGSAKAGEKPHTYTIAGRSCLAGDQIGEYSFDCELKVGDKLIFTDMAHYTMVKTSTFNGVNLPDIALWDGANYTIVKKFGYEEFKARI